MNSFWFGRCARAAVLAAAWVGVFGARGFEPPAHGELENFDRRADAAAVAAAKARPAAALRGAERAAAVAGLRARLPDVAVDGDEDVPGRMKFVRSVRGFLSGPGGEGGGVSQKSAGGVGANDPNRVTKRFLNEHASVFGHGAGALEESRVSREFTGAHNGMRSTVWQQQRAGLDVFGAVAVAHVSKNGELVNVASALVAEQQGPADSVAPVLDAAGAVVRAAGDVGTKVRVEDVAVVVAADGAELKQVLRAPGLSGESRARLVWLPMADDSLRLCWEVELTSQARGEAFRVVVDAAGGEVQVRQGLTEYLTPATYNVYTSDSPSPFSPGHSSPSTNQPPYVARTLVTLSALNTNASPNGWIDDTNNTTVGNNVDAHLDRISDDVADTGSRPVGSPFRVFDFPMDLAQAPVTYTNAAVVQLFYLCNVIHDRFYELGFTEAAGNFQNNNFGRGGVGNDAVQADAQDGGGTDNANFATYSDGIPGRMQMYLWSSSTPDRDGDFDADIVIHEYTHGLSNRRVGGGVGLSALQSRGMGEGWSDFYGVSLLSEAGDDPAGVYPMGPYALHMYGGSLWENYYYGIRRYPYCTDTNKAPLTFRDIDPAQITAHTGVPRSPRIPYSPSEATSVHRIGEVWCNALWEMRANLIAKHGFTNGNFLALRLVTDGMGLSPANPNFIQARDGILQADLVNNGGANLRELWLGFAKRGIGYSATSPASSTTTGVFESFDVPFLITLTLPATASETAGLLAGQGLVSIVLPATNNLFITLVSSNPGTLSVPAGVTLNAGSTSTNFDLTLLDDALLNGTRPVVVSASAPDYVGSSRSLSVTDSETAALAVSLPAFATEGQGTLTNAGVVSVSAVPAGNVTVTLTSGDTTEATVPASVVIPSGQTSVVFNITVVNDSLLDGGQSVTVTASVVNWTDGAASMIVNDNEGTNLTLVLPASGYEGAVATNNARVNAAGVATANVDVSLVSGDPTAVTVPATVTIPAGQSGVVFTVSFVDDALFDGSQTGVVSATASGFAGTSGVVVVRDNDVHHLALSAVASPQSAGTPFALTVTAQDIGNLTVGVFTSGVALAANGDAGALATLPTGTTAFVGGIWSGSVRVLTVSSNAVITATATNGATGQSNPFNVNVGPLDHFAWAAIPSPQQLDVPFPVTITAQDAGNNTVLAHTSAVVLAAQVGGASSATQSIGGGTVSWDFPMATFYHDARTQVIYTPAEIGAARRLTSLALEVTTLPGQTMNNWTIRLRHTALTNYSGTASWETNGWTVCFQGNLTVGSTGWVTFAFTTPFDYNGAESLMVDFSFNNSSYTTDGSCRFSSVTNQRSLYYESDSGYGDPLTWSGTTPFGSTISYIPNIRLGSAAPALLAMTPASSGAFIGGVWTGMVAVLDAATNVVLVASNAGKFGSSAIFAVEAAADLAIAVTDSPDPVLALSNLTYTITVTNNGPERASLVTVSDTLPAGATFVTGSVSVGTFSAGGILSWSVGTLSNATAATGTFVVRMPSTGVATNTATVSSGATDPNAGNNTAVNLTTVLGEGALGVGVGTLAFGGNVGGPFAPTNGIVLIVTNSGTASLAWQASWTQVWLTASLTNGTLNPGRWTNVNFAAPSNALSAGIYSNAVAFTNLTTGRGSTSRVATLSVTNPGVLGVTSASLAFAGPAGGPFAPTNFFRLTNTGSASLTWRIASNAPWLAFSATTGVLTAGATASVSVAINSNALLFGQGDYSSSVVFTNVTFGLGNTNRTVQLAVTSPRLYSFPFSTDPDWATDAGWAFGIPAGLGGANGNPDPTGGYTGTNVFGVNLSGDYSTTPGGPFRLTTPYFNLSGVTNAQLRFARWLNTDAQPGATAAIELSTNGTLWTEVWSNGSNTITDAAWTNITLPLPAADNSSIVVLRWSFAIGPGALAYSGWNLDDLEILGNLTNALTLQLPVSGTEGDGILPNAGKVMLGRAPADPVLVALASGDTTEVQVATSVTIPAGQTQAFFNVTIVDDGLFDGVQTATVTAVSAFAGGAAASMTVQDNENTNIVLFVTPPTGFTATGYTGGPFAPTSQVYSLSNSGAGPLSWRATNVAAWVRLSLSNGVLPAGGATSVVVSFNSNATLLPVGTHLDTVSFTNLTTGSGNVSRVVSLTLTNLGSAFFDDFDPGIDLPQWSSFGGVAGSTVLATNYGGFVSAPNSLWFGASGSRFAATRTLNTSGGGSLSFWLRFGNTTASTWETADLPGEGVAVEYSTNSGVSWIEFSRHTTTNFYAWTQVSSNIPAAAQHSAIQFRWRQLSNSGTGFDHWALDDVLISGTPVVVPTGSLSVTPTNALRFGGRERDLFAPTNGIMLVVTNTGTNTINWQVTWTQSWLVASVTNGTLNVGAATNINFTVPTNAMRGGTHVGPVNFLIPGIGTITSRTATLLVTNAGILGVSPPVNFAATGPAGGPFTVTNLPYVLTNHGGGTVICSAQFTNVPAWLGFSPSSVLLTSYATGALSVALTSNAYNLAPGVYSGVYRFTNTFTGGLGSTNFTATLTVTAPRVLSFPLTNDPGWTREGEWAFGKPLGLGGANGNPDPANGFTGTNVFGVNLAGDHSTATGGPFRLTTGPLNLSGVTNTQLRFARWLNTDGQTGVAVAVEFSTDGSSWSNLWDNGMNTITDSAWTNVLLDVPGADNQSNVLVRWSYTVGEGARPFSGWNLDDIEIFGYRPGLLSLELPVTGTEGSGVLTNTGIARLASVPADPVIVLLTSSDTSELQVPASVTIPAGATQALFNITIVNDTLLDGPQTAVVTGITAPFGSANAAMTVEDNENSNLTLITVASWTETAGNSVLSGTVRLGGGPTTSLVISFTSDDTSEVAVVTNITIGVGVTSATFNVTILDDALFDGMQTAYISAVAAGYVATTNGGIVVRDNELFSFSPVLSIGSPQTSGVPFSAGVTAREINGEIISNYAGALSFSATGSVGALTVTPAVTNATFVGGVWSGAVRLLTVATNIILNIAGSNSVTAQSNPFNLISGPVDHFVWDPIPSPQTVGAPFPVRIAAVDVGNNPVNTFTGRVSLEAMEWNQLSSTQTIGVGGSGVDYPFPAVQPQARIQTIYLAGEMGGAKRLGSIDVSVATLPGPGISNFTIRMKHTSMSFYDGSTGSWESIGWNTVLVTNLVVTNLGYMTFRFDSPFDYNGTNNLLVDMSYNNPTSGTSGSCWSWSAGANRSLYQQISDAGNPLSWSNRTPTPNIGTWVLNTRFTTPANQYFGIWPTNSEYFIGGIWSGEVAVLQVSTQVFLRAFDQAGRNGFSTNFLVSPTSADIGLGLESDTVAGHTASNITFTIVVTNFGPEAAADVRLTDTIPVGAVFVSNVVSQGTWSQTGRTVSCLFGSVSSGATVSAQITVRPQLAGLATNLAVVTTASADSNLVDNSASVVVPVEGEGALLVGASTGMFFTGFSGSVNFNPIYNVSLANTGTAEIGWSAAGDVPWLGLSTSAGVLLPGASVTARVWVVATNVAQFMPAGIHTGTVTFLNLSNGVGDVVRSATLSIVGRGRMAVSPASGAGADGMQGGPFVLTNNVFTLSNTGDADLVWFVSVSSSTWLTNAPSLGVIPPGGSAEVTLSTSTGANSLAVGIYTTMVSFTALSNGTGNTSRPVSLTVRPAAPALAALPPFTGGGCRSLVWNAVPGASNYLVECDSDPGFAAPQSSGWITTTNYTFCGLSNGVTYFYRVRAGRQLGGTQQTWTQTSYLDFSSNTLANISLLETPGDAVLFNTAQRVVTENFDQPGTNWSAGFFTNLSLSAGGVFGRTDLSAYPNAPNRTPELPINAGGDLEARYHGSTTSFSNSLASPLNSTPDLRYTNVVMDGYVGFAKSSNFGPRVGYVLRYNPATRLGYAATLVPATTNSLTCAIHSMSNGVLFTTMASATFPADASNENFRLRFTAASSQLIAQIWRVASDGFTTTETPAPLADGTNILMATTNVTFPGSSVALLAFASAGTNNAVCFDDITLTASGASNVFTTSGQMTTPAITLTAPDQRWSTLTFNRTTTGGTTLTVDILDTNGNPVVTGINTNTDLAALPALTNIAALHLRANLTTTNPAITPRLLDWTLQRITGGIFLQSDFSPVRSSTQDATPPQIVITSPTNLFVTTDTNILITGTALDTVSAVTSLTVGGISVLTADGYTNWQHQANDLGYGTNLFTFFARDAATNTALATVRVVRVLSAPTLAPLPLWVSGCAVLNWTPVPDATAYLAEASTNATFTPAFTSGWTTNTTHTFCNLTNGAAYFFRVTPGRNLTGTSRNWTQTTQADFASNTLNNVNITNVPGSVRLPSNTTFGTMLSIPVTLATTQRWLSAIYGGNIPVGTTLIVDLLATNGTLLATNLPVGSATPLTGTLFSAHSTLQLRATLATTNPLVTPQLNDWTLNYDAGNGPLLPGLPSAAQTTTVDNDPPLILPYYPADWDYTLTPDLPVFGTAHDPASGLAHLAANGTTVLTPDHFTNWYAELTALLPGTTNHIILTAHDNAVPPNHATNILHILYPAGTLDHDADGIPDIWEFNLFGGVSMPAGDPAADTDLDGHTTLQEYLAGTHPLITTSHLRLVATTLTPTGLRLTWQAGGNRTNILQTSGPDLHFTDLLPIPLFPEGDVTTNLTLPTTNTHLHYRLRLAP